MWIEAIAPERAVSPVGKSRKLLAQTEFQMNPELGFGDDSLRFGWQSPN